MNNIQWGWVIIVAVVAALAYGVGLFTQAMLQTAKKRPVWLRENPDAQDAIQVISDVLHRIRYGSAADAVADDALVRLAESVVQQTLLLGC